MKHQFKAMWVCGLLLLPTLGSAQSAQTNDPKAQTEMKNASGRGICGGYELLGLFGDYKGKLNVGMTSLNLVFHIYGDGRVTMDSPDQGAYDIPTTVCHLSADSIHVKMDALRAEYAGKLKDGKLIGKFTQAGYSFDLNMTPGTVTKNRPQTPQPPFSYRTEEVTFKNGDVTLGGTLTYPEKYKKGCPVVLLISGSGLQNRDEEIFGHKPFLVLADYLAKNGIASLRYDDRGVGKSTGDTESLTTLAEMQDAEAGIEYLRGTKAFGKVGVIGHSEGGTIAYMLAARKKIDFLVAMAGPAMAGDSLLLMQNHDLLLASGLDEATTQNYCMALRKIFDYKKSALKDKKAETTQDEVFDGLVKDIPLLPPMKDNLKEVFKMENAWINSLLADDPTDAVRHTTCPVMAIGGSKDLQVRASENLKYTRQYLPVSSRNFFKEYEGLNHLFQPCKRGIVLEYGQIETTISEEVLKDIAEWIKKL